MAAKERIKNKFGDHDRILMCKAAYMKLQQLVKKEENKKSHPPPPNEQQPRTPVEPPPSVGHTPVCFLIDSDSFDEDDNPVVHMPIRATSLCPR